MKHEDYMKAIKLLATWVLVLALTLTYVGCSNDTTYIIGPKHHDHGKGHHKLDDKVPCSDDTGFVWVKPEDCLCPEIRCTPWYCVVDCPK